jgi:hypothetical protein
LHPWTALGHLPSYLLPASAGLPTASAPVMASVIATAADVHLRITVVRPLVDHAKQARYRQASI